MYEKSIYDNVGSSEITAGSSIGLGSALRAAQSFQSQGAVKLSELQSEISALERNLRGVMEIVHMTGKSLEPAMRPVAETLAGNSSNPQTPVANELCGRIRSLADLAEQAQRDLTSYRNRLVV
jgi:hypothetical protein